MDRLDDISADAGMYNGAKHVTEEADHWEGSSVDESAKTLRKQLKGEAFSKTYIDKLAQDDAEIEEFERKLGIKKGRRSLPQAFKEDGLDGLIEDMGGDFASSEDETKKRKFAYDDWLHSKRKKTESRPALHSISNPLHMERPISIDDDAERSSPHPCGKRYQAVRIENRLDHTSDRKGDGYGLTAGGYEGESVEVLASGYRGSESCKPQKENPYVAPAGRSVAAKHVSLLRRCEGTESHNQVQPQLQRKIRGLINRLTDANLIWIVQSVEEMYQTNARADVTNILTDAILAQMRRPESLPDQFFVLVGGFSAAVYKLTGSSFGSHLVRNVVKGFNEYYAQTFDNDSRQTSRKEPSNFLTFLSQLYVFEVISCKIVFDYMEKLLAHLSELNVELLLKICRMVGSLLRRDDSQALHHVSRVLNSAVNNVGYANVSVRTKYMIETIQDLKNSKISAKGTDSAVVSEHVLRMKKRLGELKSQSRRQDGLAPMGIGLKDTESVDKHGEWWLVGASVPTYRDAAERARTISEVVSRGHEYAIDDEDMDFVLPDYPKKARAQGLNTTAQIAIFTAIMSGTNYEHGHRQFAALNLKKVEQLEITKVLVQCVGSEPEYNEYYALVGRQACVNSRIRFAFQDRLWRVFRNLGEPLFGEGAGDDDDTMEGERLKNKRRLGHIAQFYASLVANGSLCISILKPLDILELNEWSSLFVELFLLSLLRQCRDKGTNEDTKVERVFNPARGLSSLAANLHWFFRKKVHRSKYIGDKEFEAMQRLRRKAQAAIQASK
ncbi:suppressor of glycerol defect [Metarhizium rileyi]|uniref:Suppressor of glycerol defect n=1 Tax=Metarhizium rileyi (strain RCEF 4871) TaxID=1649241 RepID=A0A5C6GL60_METRR|nr:suppressor of glycerol defect [Metarhizium rileyi]